MEYNIYYRSDFEVLEKLMDADGNPMDLYNTDIELAYQTDGMTTMKACCKNTRLPPGISMATYMARLTNTTLMRITIPVILLTRTWAHGSRM